MTSSRALLAVRAAAIGFAAGIAVTIGIIWNVDRVAGRTADAPISTLNSATARPAVLETNLPDDLRRRDLLLPVQGVSREALRDSFDERRDSTRKHEAIDILAPRHTPVLAVEDGTIAKLFTSQAGGLTVYQFDPTSTYAYYYAHLEGYAKGLAERARVRRGQVIGYVGTSGNAPKGTPHLHFSIFKLTDKKRWWEGSALNPYAILR
jgi:peptidoglycan LD-endopeptidase LytH